MLGEVAEFDWKVDFIWIDHPKLVIMDVQQIFGMHLLVGTKETILFLISNMCGYLRFV